MSVPNSIPGPGDDLAGLIHATRRGDLQGARRHRLALRQGYRLDVTVRRDVEARQVGRLAALLEDMLAARDRGDFRRAGQLTREMTKSGIKILALPVAAGRGVA